MRQTFRSTLRWLFFTGGGTAAGFSTGILISLIILRVQEGPAAEGSIGDGIVILFLSIIGAGVGFGIGSFFGLRSKAKS